MALVRDPRTGQLVEVPDDSPAALMQTAALQPITGPNRQSRGLGPAEQVITGALGLPVALGRDVVNQLGTRGENLLRGVVGAEQVPLPGLARTGQLLEQITAGAAGVGRQQEALAGGVRGALGLPAAAPAAPAPAPVPTLAAPALGTLTNADVLAQDRTNLRAALPPEPTAAPAVSPTSLYPPAAGIQATAVQGGRPVGNVFTQQNTSNAAADGTITSALRQPATAGINFGFGAGGQETARQYLDRIGAQDVQNRLLADQRLQEATQRADISRLRDLRNDPVAFRQELRLLELTSPAALQSQELGAQFAGAGVEARGRAVEAGLQAQGATAAAQQRAAGTVTAADTAAQARLASTERAAQAGQELELLRQLRPSEQRAAAAAQLDQLALSLAEGALERRDIEGAQSIATGTAPRQARVALDALGNPIGVFSPDGRFTPYTADELRAVRAASAAASGIGG